MVRISDILKRGKGEDEEPKKPPEGAKTKGDPRQNAGYEEVKKEALPEPEAKKTIKEERQPSHLEIARVMMEKTKVGRPQPKELYDELLALMSDIAAKGKRHEPIEGKEIVAKIDRVVDQMAVAGDELMGLINDFTPEDYLDVHSVNVCILSIRLGLGLGYNKSKLEDLGIAGLLYDIGMIKVMDIAKQPRRLAAEEYDEIKQHPVYGVEILKKATNLNEAAIYVAHEQHERMTGDGYPRGLKNGEINEYARMIGLVDIYEALTHPRAYRKRYQPYEAIKEILKNRDGFDVRFLKTLISEVSVYPIGSWVELSTNEIGKVIRTNKDLPLRPTVTVLFSTDGRKLDETKTIDLARHPTLYVKKPLDESELRPKVAASE